MPHLPLPRLRRTARLVVGEPGIGWPDGRADPGVLTAWSDVSAVRVYRQDPAPGLGVGIPRRRRRPVVHLDLHDGGCRRWLGTPGRVGLRQVHDIVDAVRVLSSGVPVLVEGCYVVER